MNGKLPFRLGVITDEVSDDFAVALRAAVEWGLPTIEINDLWGKNVTDLTEAEAERVESLIAEARVEVAAIDTPCFKTLVLDNGSDVRDAPAFREDLDRLECGLALARRFDTRLIRIFSFRKPTTVGLGNPSPRLPDGGPVDDATLARIVAGLREACERAAAHDIVLGVENVRSCWGNTGINTARIVSAVDSPWLRVIWDPANDYVSGGDAYPGGYEAVKDLTVHLQVKDARVLDAETGLTSWEMMGAGDVDYDGQFAALIRDGYSGVVSLETHWQPPERPRIENSRHSLAGLKRILGRLPRSASPGLPN